MKRYIDGPKLVAWIKQRLTDESVDTRYGRNVSRRLYDWERGVPADVFAVDRLFTMMGHHLAELPESFYVDAPPRNEPVSPATQERALAMYVAGKPTREIVAQLGVSTQSLYRWRRRAGIPTHEFAAAEERRRRGYELLNTTDLTDEEIGEQLGICRATVNNWRNDDRRFE